MRLWMEYLISNPGMAEDFISWAKEAEHNLNTEVNKQVIAGEFEKARGAAHEIEVYRELARLIKAELRERNSQVTYEREMGGNV